MRQAASLKNVTGSLSLPGMVINTSPTDYRINKQMQMMKFNGERWELFGPIIEDSGPAADAATFGRSRRRPMIRRLLVCVPAQALHHFAAATDDV